MVKIGPKIPPISRRELERREKELKRATQLENGTNLSLLGEPRENLFLLLSRSKRPKSRRPTAQEIEEIKRRREKTQLRAAARKAAKAVKSESQIGSAECFREAGEWPQSGLIIDNDASNPSGFMNSQRQDPLVHTVPAASQFQVLSPFAGNVPEASLSLDSSVPSLIPFFTEKVPSVMGNEEPVDLCSPSIWSADTGCHPWNQAFYPRAETPGLSSSVDSEQTRRTEEKIVRPNPSADVPATQLAVNGRQSVRILRDIVQVPSGLRSKTRKVLLGASAPVPNRARSSSSKIFSRPLDVSRFSTKACSTRLAHSSFTGRSGQSTKNGDLVADNLGNNLRSLGLSSSSSSMTFVTSSGSLKPDSSLCKAQSSIATRAKRLTAADFFDTSDDHLQFLAPNSETSTSAHGTTIALVNTNSLVQAFTSEQQVPALNLANNIKEYTGSGDDGNISSLSPYTRASATQSQQNNAEMGASNTLNGVGSHFTSLPMSNVLAPAASITGRKLATSCHSNLLSTTTLTERQIAEIDDIEKGMIGFRDPGLETPKPSSRIRVYRWMPSGSPRSIFQDPSPESPLPQSGVIPPASTPASDAPIFFGMALPSPSWRQPVLLPFPVNLQRTDDGGMFSMLKWALKKTWRMLWQ